MVRPYSMKGQKRKKRGERYDREDPEEQFDEHEEEREENETTQEANEENEAADAHDLAGIPVETVVENNLSGAIFILEKASLEVAKVGKSYQLLNCDDHANFLKRNNRDPAQYRPDIAHQAILAILDSPLNKAGRLRALYVKTDKGVLFEIKPYVRIPRTFKRFSGIMLQLLQKLSISAAGKREKLLRVIKNPVTQYLPINSRKIGFSYSSEKLVDIQDYVAAVSDDVNFVFVVGAMAHGKIDKDCAEDYISISGYPMSAAGCISRICGGLERKWKIL